MGNNCLKVAVGNETVSHIPSEPEQVPTFENL